MMPKTVANDTFKRTDERGGGGGGGGGGGPSPPSSSPLLAAGGKGEREEERKKVMKVRIRQFFPRRFKAIHKLSYIVESPPWFVPLSGAT